MNLYGCPATGTVSLSVPPLVRLLYFGTYVIGTFTLLYNFVKSVRKQYGNLDSHPFFYRDIKF